MSWRTKAGVALAAVVLAPVAVELVIQGLGDPRRREMEEQARKIPGYWDLARAGILLPDDEAMRFRLRPGFAATVAGIEYRVNERGLRGGPLEPAPRPGTRRVLVGGDSYAFGLGVTEREALPVQLEEQLRRAARDGPDGDPVEVVNFGVPAYQTGQELALLERLGFALAPDLVVLLYYANDNVETALSLAPSIGALYVDELPLPHAWKAALSRSYLYSRIARLDAARRDARGDFDPRGTRNWPVTAERLRRYAAACRRHGVAFLLAPLPELSSHRELDDDASEQSADHARVIDLARVEGWPVVDLRAGLRGSVPAIERLFLTLRPRDVHLNPEGHRLVAELLAPEVRRLLRRRRPRRRAPAGPPRGELRPGSMDRLKGGHPRPAGELPHPLTPCAPHAATSRPPRESSVPGARSSGCAPRRAGPRRGRAGRARATGAGDEAGRPRRAQPRGADGDRRRHRLRRLPAAADHGAGARGMGKTSATYDPGGRSRPALAARWKTKL